MWQFVTAAPVNSYREIGPSSPSFHPAAWKAEKRAGLPLAILVHEDEVEQRAKWSLKLYGTVRLALDCLPWGLFSWKISIFEYSVIVIVLFVF